MQIEQQPNAYTGRQQFDLQHLSKKTKYELLINDHNYNLRCEEEPAKPIAANGKPEKQRQTAECPAAASEHELAAEALAVEAAGGRMDDCMAAMVLMYLSSNSGAEAKPATSGSQSSHSAKHFQQEKPLGSSSSIIQQEAGKSGKGEFSGRALEFTQWPLGAPNGQRRPVSMSDGGGLCLARAMLARTSPCVRNAAPVCALRPLERRPAPPDRAAATSCAAIAPFCTHS